MKTGCPTQILPQIPNKNKLLRIQDMLSSKAKHRLEIIDWYRLESKKYSDNNKPNISLTCLHFGISRSYLYKWLKRFKTYNLKMLEDKSRKPFTLRKCEYSSECVDIIKQIRIENPTYSCKKIKPILEEHYDIFISKSTIGRIIQKNKLFYKPAKEKNEKLSKSSTKTQARKRLPYNLRTEKPNEIIEFDMKHINMMGRKYYAMCAIDQFTKRALVHIAGTSSSMQAQIALQKVVGKFGKDICIVNDNGSENMGRAEEWLKENKIEQFWARPHKPKDKPYIERFIGTLERECLKFNYGCHTVESLQQIIDKWLEKYETYRPHESLNFLTPQTYEKYYYNRNQKYQKVSTMY